MTGNNYGYFKSDLTGLYVIHDKKGKKTFSGIADEYTCKRIVNLLNKKDERIKELESEKEFWRYNCIHESSRNSILMFELDLAREQGYEWSDAFKEYENSVKENSEWNKKYISEKGSGDVND